MEKPPIGLMPREIYERISECKRIDDIIDAMKRYANVGKTVPIEWVEELEERAKNYI